MKSIYIIYDQWCDDPITFFHAVSEEDFDDYVEAMYQKLEKEVDELLVDVISVNSPPKRYSTEIGNSVHLSVLADVTFEAGGVTFREKQQGRSINYAKINMWERGQDLPEL